LFSTTGCTGGAARVLWVGKLARARIMFEIFEKKVKGSKKVKKLT
jgi:hypothetical protein